MTDARGRSLYRLLDVAVLLFAWGIRLYRLGFQSIWWDEGRNINAAMQPLSRIPHAPAVDIHPPLYFYALHFWLRVSGHTEFAVRFLSTFFGFLTLPLLYLLGRELFDEDAARFALLLGGIAPFFVGEAQEARMYTFAFLWIALAALAFWRAWKNPAEFGYWLLFGVASALAMLTHYSSIFVLAAFYLLAGLAALDGVSKKDWRPIVGVGISVAAGFLLFSPQALTFWHQVSGYYNKNLTPPGIGKYLYRCWQAFTLGENVSPAWVERWSMPLWMLTIPGMLLALVKYRKRGIDPWAFLLAWITIPLGIYYWQVLRRGAFEPRYISFIAPAWWLVLAASLAGYLKTRKWAGAVALLFFLGAILPALHSDLANPRYFRDDTRGLAEFLRTKAKGDDVIIVDAPFPLQFYYPRFSENPGEPPAGPRDEAPAYYIFVDVHTIDREMRAVAQGKKRVFLVHWYKSDADPRGIVKFLLNKYGVLEGKRDFRGYHVEWYSVPPDAGYKMADSWKPVNVRFRGGLLLKSLSYGGHGGNVDGRSVPADRPAWVAVDWSAWRTMGVDLKASVFLEDGTGHKIGQDDRKLLNDRHLGTRYWKPGEDAVNVHTVFPLPAAAPGRYRLEMTVYDPRSGKNLPVLDSSGEPEGIVVAIGEMDLTPPVHPVVNVSPEHPVTYAGNFPLRLLGYDGELAEVSPGGNIALRLYWECEECKDGAFRYSLFLKNGDVNIPLVEKGKVLATGSHNGFWRSGEVIAPWYSWKVPPSAKSGVYKLGICWGDDEDGCAAGSQLGRLKISGRPHRFEKPKSQRSADEKFGRVARLTGYSILMPQESRRDLQVVLVWQAVAPAEKPYKAFVHVLDGSGRLISQRDAEPCDGKCPVTGWVPGEFIVDEYDIPAPAAGWKDAAWLEVGLYDPETGVRLRTDPPMPGDALRLPLR